MFNIMEYQPTLVGWHVIGAGTPKTVAAEAVAGVAAAGAACKMT
jgi:hypothetical protein